MFFVYPDPKVKKNYFLRSLRRNGQQRGFNDENYERMGKVNDELIGNIKHKNIGKNFLISKYSLKNIFFLCTKKEKEMGVY